MQDFPLARTAPTRRGLLRLSGAALLLAAASRVRAQDKPPLKIIMPYPAGGLLDVLVRHAAVSMAKTLNRPVVVDNRVGAAGLIGTRATQNAPADGNTIMMQNIGFISLPMMQKATNYDPFKDFVPVASLADGPAFIVVHESVPARTLPELIAYAKSKPGALTAATSGVNGASHISTMLFARMAGIEVLPVPYKGGAEMQTALIGGEAKLMISNLSEVFNQQVKAGRLRVLAVASAQPSPLTPGLPMVQQTVPGFVIEGWNAFFALAATPPAEIAAITAAVKIAVEEQGFRDKATALFLEAHYQSPQQLLASANRTADFYRKVVTELNITPQ